MSRTSSFLLAGLVLLGACGDDDTTGPDNNPSGSSYELTVEGAVEDDLEGTAAFAVVTDEGITSFGIALTEAGGSNTIVLERVGGTRPGNGTYTVGDLNADGEQDPAKFYAAFVAGTSQNPSDVFVSVSGTVTITKSSSDQVKGTIDMTLVGLQGEEEVTITGEFDARGGTVTELSVARVPAGSAR